MIDVFSILIYKKNSVPTIASPYNIYRNSSPTSSSDLLFLSQRNQRFPLFLTLSPLLLSLSPLPPILKKEQGEGELGKFQLLPAGGLPKKERKYTAVEDMEEGVHTGRSLGYLTRNLLDAKKNFNKNFSKARQLACQQCITDKPSGKQHCQQLLAQCYQPPLLVNFRVTEDLYNCDVCSSYYYYERQIIII